jgi:hypothetical protein
MTSNSNSARLRNRQASQEKNAEMNASMSARQEISLDFSTLSSFQ